MESKLLIIGLFCMFIMMFSFLFSIILYVFNRDYRIYTERGRKISFIIINILSIASLVIGIVGIGFALASFLMCIS